MCGRYVRKSDKQRLAEQLRARLNSPGSADEPFLPRSRTIRFEYEPFLFHLGQWRTCCVASTSPMNMAK